MLLLTVGMVAATKDTPAGLAYSTTWRLLARRHLRRFAPRRPRCGGGGGSGCGLGGLTVSGGSRILPHLGAYPRVGVACDAARDALLASVQRA